MTDSLARTSAGVPEASTRPEAITTDGVGERHEEVHVVVDDDHAEPEARRGPGGSPGPASIASPTSMPTAGSSSSSTLGAVLSAVAIIASRWPPLLSDAHGRSRAASRPSRRAISPRLKRSTARRRSRSPCGEAHALAQRPRRRTAGWSGRCDRCRRARSAAGPCPEIGRPSSNTAPCVGAWVPARMLSSVVLPDPLGPISPSDRARSRPAATRRRPPSARRSAC